MTRTRITKLDMESPSEAAGEAFVTDGAGNVVVSGVPAEGHTHIETDITDIEHDATKIQGRDVNAGAPSAGQTYRWSGSDWVPSGVVAVDENIGEIQEAGAQVATGVSILNFKGTAVNQLTDEGGGKVDIDLSASGSGATVFTGLTDTPASYAGQGGKAVLVKGTTDGLEFGEAGGGGSDLALKDEGAILTSSGNSIDFTGTAVTATASGTAVTVAVDGVIAQIPDFSGARWHLTTDHTMETTTGWEEIAGSSDDYTKVYDTEDTGTVYYDSWEIFKVPVDDYYHFDAQVKWNPPVDPERIEFSIFAINTPIALNVVRPAASGVSMTQHLSFDFFCLASATYRMMALHSTGGIGPIAASGVGNTFMCIRRLQDGATLGPFSGARIIRTSDATITDETYTDIIWQDDGASQPNYAYDTSTYWISGDNTKISIPASGYYHVAAQLMWDGWGGGSDRVAQIELNDITIIAEAAVRTAGSDGDAERQPQPLTFDFFFDAGDYIKLRGWHNRGSSLNFKGSTEGHSTFISISKAGEP